MMMVMMPLLFSPLPDCCNAVQCRCTNLQTDSGTRRRDNNQEAQWKKNTRDTLNGILSFFRILGVHSIRHSNHSTPP